MPPSNQPPIMAAYAWASPTPGITAGTNAGRSEPRRDRGDTTKGEGRVRVTATTLAIAAALLLAAATTARAVTRTPHRCAHKSSPVLCAIHFHLDRANHYRHLMGSPSIAYRWIAERKSTSHARRERILTYWMHTQRSAHTRYQRWRKAQAGQIPEPYRSHLMCIHHYEGSWTAYNPAGPYLGGFQMDAAFIQRWGRSMIARYGSDARYWPPHAQMLVAYHAARRIGYHGSWPNTSAMCGL